HRSIRKRQVERTVNIQPGTVRPWHTVDQCEVADDDDLAVRLNRHSENTVVRNVWRTKGRINRTGRRKPRDVGPKNSTRGAESTGNQYAAVRIDMKRLHRTAAFQDVRP